MIQKVRGETVQEKLILETKINNKMDWQFVFFKIHLEIINILLV